MNTAEQIVFNLVGPGTVAEWNERLPQRPDWQRYVQDVQELIDIELAAATAYMEAATNGYQKRCAVLEAQLSAAQESAAYHHQNYLRLLMIADSVAEVHVL